jgi:hypothetical protein
MFRYYHLYAILTGILLFYFVDPFSKIAIGTFYILLCWFHICTYLATAPMDFNTGAYCPKCRRVTGLGLNHCNTCDICVPGKWAHCDKLGRCTEKHLQKRLMYLFKLIILMYTLMSCIYALATPWLLALIPLHIYVLKTTYK